METPVVPPLNLTPVNSGAPTLLPQTNLEVLQQERQREEQSVSPVDFFAEAIRQDTILWAATRELDMAGFKEDGSELPDIDTPEGREWWAEVPTDLIEELQESAVSLSHGEALKQQLKDSLRREEILAQAGGWAIPGRLLVGITDPVALAVGVATGGLGTFSKASRAKRIFATGAVVGAESAAIEAYLERNDIAKSDTDVVIAGLMGFGLGALATPGMTPREYSEAAASVNRTVDREIARDMAEAGVPVRIEPEAPMQATVVGGFGDDSAGAARVAGEEFRPLGDSGEARAFPDEDTANQASAFAAKAGTAKLTFASQLLGTDDPVVTNLFRGLIHDPAGGNVRNGSVNFLSASEGKAMREKSWLAGFYRPFNPVYKEWAKAQGFGAIKRRSPTVRRMFNSQVTAYLRGEAVTDPHVIKLGDQIDQSFRNIFEEAKRAGVKGFDGEGVEFYVPRYAKHETFTKLAQSESGVGTSRIEELFAESFRRATDVDPQVAARVAKNYVLKVRRLGAGYDDAEVRLSQLPDAEYFRSMLEEAMPGVSSQQLDEAIQKITDAVQARAARGEGGTVSHGRSRLPLDESFSMQLPDGRVLRVADFFEEDIEHIFSRYTRTMAGYVSMAKEAGIKSDADWEALKKQVVTRLDETGQAAQAQTVLANLEAYRKLLVGVSLDSEPNSALNTTLRVIRDINFPRVMNSVGFAQISDLFKTFSPKYGALVFKQIPEMKAMFTRMADGRLEDALAADLEELIGTGTDFLRNNVYTAFDEFGFGAGADGFVGLAEFGLRSASRGTQVISGLALVNNMMQRTIAKSVFLRFARGASGRKAAAFTDVELRMLGITPEQFKTIQAELNRVVQWDGDKVASSGLRSMEPDVRDKLLLVMHREATRIIQENDIAATHRYMHTSIGKTLFQFRTFSITAHSKALLAGLNRRDVDTVVSVAMSSVGGALGWATQKYLSTINDPEARRKQLTYENLYAAMMSRSAYAGLLPTAIDTGLPAFGVDPIFGAVRSTGGSYNLMSVDGNPSIDFVNSAFKGFTGLTRSMGGGHQFSRKDAKAMQRAMLFGNFIPFQIVMNSWMKTLPKSSQVEKKERTGTPIL